MYKATFIFPLGEKQEAQEQERPKSCPYCGHSPVHRHGTAEMKGQNISVPRYHCGECKATFRIHPRGVKEHSRTNRKAVAIASLLWSLGISSKSVEQITKGLGFSISGTTAWRFGTAIGSQHPRGSTQNLLVVLKNGETWDNLETTNPGKTVLLRVLTNSEGQKRGLIVWFDLEVDLTKVQGLAKESGCSLTLSAPTGR